QTPRQPSGGSNSKSRAGANFVSRRRGSARETGIGVRNFWTWSISVSPDSSRTDRDQAGQRMPNPLFSRQKGQSTHEKIVHSVLYFGRSETIILLSERQFRQRAGLGD